MGFVLLGVLLLVLKLGGWAKFSESDFVAWLIVLAPFALAVAWWTWSDASGHTQRKVMDQLDAKRAARREQQMQALGQQRHGVKKRR